MLIINDFVSFEQLGPGWYFVHEQDFLNLCMFEGFSSPDTA